VTHDEIRDEALRRIKAQLEAACSMELPPWLRAVGEMWRCGLHPTAGADTFIDVERNALILRCRTCGQDLTISPVVRVDTFECPAGLPPEPPIPIVAFSVESKAMSKHQDDSFQMSRGLVLSKPAEVGASEDVKP
jgi:hypothetical protein